LPDINEQRGYFGLRSAAQASGVTLTKPCRRNNYPVTSPPQADYTWGITSALFKHGIQYGTYRFWTVPRLDQGRPIPPASPVQQERQLES
jgi:hypothetical protein